MAFPTVAGSLQKSVESASVTAHDVAFDAAASADQILLAIVFHDGNATWTADTGNGWAILASGNISTVASMAIAWKRAAGGETTTVVTSSAAERSSHIGIRIQGAHTSTNPEISTAATGTGTTPNPGSLNPSGWDVEDTMWWAVYGVDSGSASAYPLPDNNLTTSSTDVTSAAYGAVCSDELAQASLDPGTFTNTISDDWRAYTIAIRPAPAGSVSVTPTTASLVLATFAPTVLTPVLLTPTTASLTLTTFAPTVLTPVLVTPTTAGLVLTGFAPDVTVSAGGSVSVTPTTAALSLTAFAPTVVASDHKIVTPTTASLAMTAFAPNVVATDHKLVTPATAALTLTGFAPTVTASGQEGPSRIGTPLGTSRGEPVTVSFG